MNPVIQALITTALIACSTFASAQLQNQDPEKLATEAVNELVAHRFSKVEARFDDRMQNGLPADKLSAVWDALIDKAGPFERIVGTHLDEQMGMRVVRVTCKFKFDSFDLQFAVDNKAQGHRLHASGRAGAWQFAPQNRRESEAHKIVERTSGQVSVDQLHVDGARLFHGLGDGRAGNGVEHHTLYLSVAERPAAA